jgi:DNA-binding PadR family transcriptional regulator
VISSFGEDYGRGTRTELILSALRAKPDSALSKTDIHELFGNHLPKDQLDPVLLAMERRDLIEIIEDRTKRGRPRISLKLVKNA